MDSIQKSLEQVTGKRAILMRGGGAIPIGGMFQKALGIPLASFGFSPGEGIHAPNEYLILDDFFKAIDAGIHFYHYLAEA
jgi:acetylornithine deacetylase/succinyl-diaminopimelate desuccinylase-like protein